MSVANTIELATNMDAFDELLTNMLRGRAGSPPPGLEQRLMARLANGPVAATAGIFTTFERANPRRTSASLWWALAGHAAMFLVIFAVASAHVSVRMAPKVTVVTMEAPPLPPAVTPRMDKLGGGGGQQGPSPASQGRLPKFAVRQILPPMAPPVLAPKLPVEPTVVVQPDLKMAENHMPDLGVPNSTVKGVSVGNGRGSGIGGGDGDGVGPGRGGGAGGGLLHAGGMLKPEVLYSVEPEFSEEARKAKFSGNVQVYLWVDEQGRPSHVRISRGIGMGLDEKAVEAVKQYRFKPAMKDGRPVKVDMYVDVNFTIM